MSETDDFDGFDDPEAHDAADSGVLVLDLEGYEGPIDMLL